MIASTDRIQPITNLWIRLNTKVFSLSNKVILRSRLVEILTPLLTQLGVGGVAGLCSGYALKKLGKIAAFIIGIFFLALQLLAYYGIISINYSAFVDWANGLFAQVGVLEGVFGTIVGNLPFAGGFLAGFAIGVKIG